jgi:hypothetical protein
LFAARPRKIAPFSAPKLLTVSGKSGIASAFGVMQPRLCRSRSSPQAFDIAGLSQFGFAYEAES